MKSHFSKAILYTTFAIVGSGVRLSAQLSTAAIQGTVRDATGAAVPAAAIVLHNNATNVETNTASNGTGDYAIVNIPPGTYSLRVSKPGFQSAQQSEVVLSVNQTAEYNFTLQVGSAEQTV